MNETRREQTQETINAVRASAETDHARALADHAEWLLAEVTRLESVISANQKLREHAEAEARDALARRDHWERNSLLWKRTADETQAKLATYETRFEQFKATVLGLCKGDGT